MALTVCVDVPPRDREVLASWVRSPSIRAGLAQRARIVLLAADGAGTNEIVRMTGVSKPTVIAWKRRYAAEGIGGLEDRPKPGRPRWTDDVAIVLAFTGLRWEEAVAVPIGNVDLDGQWITVDRTASESGGKRDIRDDLKTRAAERVAAIPDIAMPAVRRLIDSGAKGRELSDGKKFVLLINGERGGYLGYSMWRRYLGLAHGYTAAHKDGIVKYTAHELRHVCASLLIASGAKDTQVCRQMGHRKIETTKNIYGHLFAQDQESILKAMNQAVTRLYIEDETDGDEPVA